MNAIATLLPAAAESAVAVTSVDTPLGAMHVASLRAGICAAVFDERCEALEPRLRRMFGAFLNVAAGDPLDLGPRLRAYFDGSLDALRDVPQAVAATPMQRRVWALVNVLPAGSSTTYAAIADRIGMPRAQRAVGVCLASNPIPLFIPCHRVVAASGSIAGYPGGALRKQWLLRHERALPITDLTAVRTRGARRVADLDPSDRVELVELPRVVGY